MLQTPEVRLARSPGRRLSWVRGREREERAEGASRQLEGDLEPAWLRRPPPPREGGDRRSGRLGDMLADLGRFLVRRPSEADTSEE